MFGEKGDHVRPQTFDVLFGQVSHHGVGGEYPKSIRSTAACIRNLPTIENTAAWTSSTLEHGVYVPGESEVQWQSQI
jgi:hypothetical protein